MSWAGKKVLVLGAGESGLSMARHLAGAGAALRVADTRDAPPGAPALLAAAPEAELVWGAFTPALFEGVDAVAVSPGVPVSGPLADAAVLEAKAGGLPFMGDVELFALALAEEKEAAGYAPKILAITGTNGKTTVTALTTYLANRAGKRATYAGNISPAALDAWHAAKQAGSLPEIWVLELSSYQLETTSSLVPDAAVMLNLTEDHLDRHGSMQDYAAAKARIFAAGGLQILNRDDPASLAMRRPFVPKGKKDAPPPVVTFGASEPQSEYEYGLVREARQGGLTWLCEGTADGPKRLMPVEVLKIKGQHNALNVLAALALNRSIGLNLAPMLKALTDYAGEAHRVQPVAEVAGVTYIDDSKGTNVGATLAALNGLGSELRDGRKLVLIAGGVGKGQNFEPLALPVAVYCRAVMLIGQDAAVMEQALTEAGTPLIRCETLEQAVQSAARLAQAGDIVLLSPACASLDMFRNYAHRAEVFVEAVRNLGREEETADPAAVVQAAAPEAAEAAAQASDAAAPADAGESVATESVATESVATESVATESVATESVATESVATESVATESVATESVATESVATESVATEPVATEPVATEPVATEPLDLTPAADAADSVAPAPQPEPEAAAGGEIEAENLAGEQTHVSPDPAQVSGQDAPAAVGAGDVAQEPKEGGTGEREDAQDGDNAADDPEHPKGDGQHG